MNAPKISTEQIRRESHAKIADVAAAHNVSTRTVERARARAGVARQGARYLSEAELARAEVLLAERMPMNWIADDLGRPPGTLRARFKPGNDPEWASAWHHIRQHEELLALHREFAPRRVR